MLTSYRILVLKDGQIVEQGTHKELLALDGIFATMWADQVSSNDGISVAGNSLKKEQSQASFKRDGSVKGYDAEAIIPMDNVLDQRSNFIEESANVPMSFEDKQDTGAAPASAEEPEISDKNADGLEKPVESAAELKEDKAEETSTAATKSAPETQPIAFPSSAPVEEEESQQIRESPKKSPISLENSDGDKSEIAAPAPIAFPGESTPEKPQGPSPPAVTFGASAFSPPRTGTPDPESEPKRKRISSQNFQRLARRISLTTRRQNSVTSILPDILKRDSSPRVSTDEGTSPRGEGSSTVVSESPAGSLRGEEVPKLKKSKKEKKRKGTL